MEVGKPTSCTSYDIFGVKSIKVFESIIFLKEKDRKEQERSKPEADLANVTYELSSKGRNTNLTTKLPGLHEKKPSNILFKCKQ